LEIKLARNYSSPVYRGYVLGVFVLAYSFNFIDRYIMIILQEPIKAEFALSDTQLGLLTGFAFAMFNVVCVIPLTTGAQNLAGLMAGILGGTGTLLGS
jgi:hypothetical protein